MFSKRARIPHEDTDVDEDELKPSPTALTDEAPREQGDLSPAVLKAQQKAKDNSKTVTREQLIRNRKQHTSRELTTGACLQCYPPGSQTPAGELENQCLAGSLHQLRGIHSFVCSPLPRGPDPAHRHTFSCFPSRFVSIFRGCKRLVIPVCANVHQNTDSEETPTQALPTLLWCVQYLLLVDIS